MLLHCSSLYGAKGTPHPPSIQVASYKKIYTKVLVASQHWEVNIEVMSNKAYTSEEKRFVTRPVNKYMSFDGLAILHNSKNTW